MTCESSRAWRRDAETRAKLGAMKNLARGMGVAVLMVIAAAPALAQQQPAAPTAPTPPTPKSGDTPPAVLSLLLAGGMIALVTFANVVTTKRSHQD